ncbi:MAG: response regulator [Chloroflexi bacterium]|nr:response regulator [Chloroflexota bacterium]
MLAGQAADAGLLAEIYDLEHDEVLEDLVFYREWARRQGGDVVDLGCGSGRLFRSFLEGGARSILGVEGSRALLERAATRISADPVLRSARDEGRIQLVLDDVRTVARAEPFGLAVLAGVLSHLDGPADAIRALRAAGRLLEEGGALIVDLVGPGGVPTEDLPMSVDWERIVDGRRVLRRSRIDVSETSDGRRVAYETLTDLEGPDGTMARLPARFRLWYPSPSELFTLAKEADLEVEATFGSHDLDPLEEGSDRCIAVMRRATATPGGGEMPAEQIRLMVVEDVPQVASHIRSLLQSQTQIKMLEVVSSGDQAMSSVADLKPDVVIVDALLQGRVRGSEVAEQIRKAEPQVGLIMLTVPQNPVSENPERGVDAVLILQVLTFEMMAIRAVAMAGETFEAIGSPVLVRN